MNIDHPQPLLPMRRGDALIRDDATSNAILSEKDPVIRGCAENFRAQVAVIARKYGATAGTVWNADVMARMNVDDLTRATELVRAIGELSRGKVTAAARREIAVWIEGRGDRARDMWEDAYRMYDFEADPLAAAEVVKMLLRAGYVTDAVNLAVGAQGAGPRASKFPKSLWTKIRLAQAMATTNPVDRAQILLDGVITASTEKINLGEWLDEFGEAYGARIEFRSDAQLDQLLEDLISIPPLMRPYALARLSSEYERRGLEMPEHDGMKDTVQGSLLSFSLRGRILVDLKIAESRKGLGLEFRSHFDKAVREVSTNSSDPNRCIEDLARSAGRIGALDAVENLERADWWNPREDGLLWTSPRLEAAVGAAEAGNVSNALELYDRAMTRGRNAFSRDYFPAAYDALVNALLNADAIDAAKRVVEAYVGGPFSSSYLASPELLAYAAARARNGEEILAEERQRVLNAPTAPSSERALILANAAIATLGSLDSVKKRIETYGTAR